jgi:hypothetical protein
VKNELLKTWIDAPEAVQEVDHEEREKESQVPLTSPIISTEQSSDERRRLFILPFLRKFSGERSVIGADDDAGQQIREMVCNVATEKTKKRSEERIN